MYQTGAERVQSTSRLTITINYDRMSGILGHLLKSKSYQRIVDEF